jgi:hypothetical protein
MGAFPVWSATMREAARSPIPYVLAGVGALLYWAGSVLELLALSRDAARARDLLVGSMESCACLAAILLAAKAAGDDRRGELTPMIAAAAAGPRALWLCRVLTAALAGVICSLSVLAVAPITMHYTSISSNSVYSAVIVGVPLIGIEVLALSAWAALVGSAVGSWPGVACGCALFVAARAGPASPWLGWLPVPAATSADAVDVARGVLALLGPFAIGAWVSARDTSPA